MGEHRHMLNFLSSSSWRISCGARRLPRSKKDIPTNILNSNFHIQIQVLFFRVQENARVIFSSVYFAIRYTGALEV
jgi:hypothetical protein